MQLKHYVLLVVHALVPLLIAFLSHWDQKITTASVVVAIAGAISVLTKSPSQGGAS